MLESLKMLNVHYSKPELDSANYEEFDELVDVTQNRMIPSINHLKKLETLKINLLALPEKNHKIIFDWFVLELPKTLRNIILDEGDFKGGYLIEPIVLAYPDMEILNLSQCKIPANTDLNIFAKLNNAKIITLPCIEHRKFAFSNDIKILAINCVARSSSHHPDHKFHNWKNEFLDDPNSTKADQIHRFEDHMSRVGNNISYRMIEEKCTCSRLKAPFKHTVIKYNQNGYIINFFLSEITNWGDVMENIKLL
uniref:Leucine-rich repeat domain-containing protein n=1 Tax=Rhabditophanes sp. KR3021 TaxID=114890 RepID=A0AC35U6J5_9BILA